MAPSLEWSAQFDVSPTSTLQGDKISLPQSALEQLLTAAPTVETVATAAINGHPSSFDPYNPYTYAAERHVRSQFRTEQQQLPHPLNFRLVNPSNGRAVYAGIREFSADDGQVQLSSFLLQALGIEPGYEGQKGAGKSENAGEIDGEDTRRSEHILPRVTIHAKQLAKGTFVKLRPLEAGYNPEDWKSLLEEHLRRNFTTLTKGEILNVSAGRNEIFQFLIYEFKPGDDGICIVDTDLEVDIEALNEEQARETLRRVAQKIHRAPGTEAGSSTGGALNIFKPLPEQQIVEGEYVDYELPSWPRSQALEFELDAGEADGAFDLLISPFGPRQRARPREEEHVFADFEDRPSKRIRLSPTNVELEQAESLYVSVHANATGTVPSSSPLRYTLRASAVDPDIPAPVDKPTASAPDASPDESICANCNHAIPKTSFHLHTTFCARNNILCPHGCGIVFQRRAPAYRTHWHCPEPHCTSHGGISASYEKHIRIFHTPIASCPSCPQPSSKSFANIPQLAQHLTTTCPGKLILCRFCHLSVPQESSDDPRLALTGLTPHEAADGARTTDCDVCAKPVRLRDMDVHMAHHNHERLRRPPPVICRNPLCGRTVHGVSRDGNTRANAAGSAGDAETTGLCAVCFGPLYTGAYDPEGKALKRRVERRLLQQCLVGCGRAWCENAACCRTAKVNAAAAEGRSETKVPKVGVKEALPIVKPFVDALFERQDGVGLPFCVDEGTRRRREMGEESAATEGVGRPGVRRYRLEWWVGALEAEGGDVSRARGWLEKFGVGMDEIR